MVASGEIRHSIDVEVWWVDVEAAAHAEQLEAWLDPGETTRAARYLHQVDRRRFVLGAALVRAIGGRALGRPAACVPLDRCCPTCGEPHGKVRIAVAGAPEVSVSHAGRLVGVAVCWQRPVGLDVEPLGRDAAPRLADLAVGLGVREVAALRAVPAAERARTARRLWTRKEAALKASGHGLTVPPERVCVGGPVGRPGWGAWPVECGARPSVADLDPAPDHVAACAGYGPLTVRERDGEELLAHVVGRHQPVVSELYPGQFGSDSARVSSGPRVCDPLRCERSSLTTSTTAVRSTSFVRPDESDISSA